MTSRWLNALPRPIAFVFSGGAALGAIQVGMLKALLKVGLHPDLTVGTSAGALNGAMVAERGLEHGVEQLEDLWRNFKRDDIFPGGRFSQIRQLLTTRNSLFPNNRLCELICRMVDEPTFESLSLPFAALATDLDSRHGALFNAGDLRLALLASAAIPGIYPPVEIGGRLYVDGGLTALLPLNGAVEMGAASIVALDAGEICQINKPSRHIADMFSITLQSTMRQRVRVEAPVVAQQIPMLYLPTPCPITSSAFHFDAGGELIDAAEQMGLDFLEECDIPEAGRMSGAPHFHNSEPIFRLTEVRPA